MEAFRSPVCFMNFWADSLPTSLLDISILLFTLSISKQRVCVTNIEDFFWGEGVCKVKTYTYLPPTKNVGQVGMVCAIALGRWFLQNHAPLADPGLHWAPSSAAAPGPIWASSCRRSRSSQLPTARVQRHSRGAFTEAKKEGRKHEKAR